MYNPVLGAHIVAAFCLLFDKPVKKSWISFLVYLTQKDVLQRHATLLLDGNHKLINGYPHVQEIYNDLMMMHSSVWSDLLHEKDDFVQNNPGTKWDYLDELSLACIESIRYVFHNMKSLEHDNAYCPSVDAFPELDALCNNDSISLLKMIKNSGLSDPEGVYDHILTMQGLSKAFDI